jgi:diketogulonate reductase-like aldo/keto reductase
MPIFNSSFTLPSGLPVLFLGQGTWKIGDSPAARELEVAALRLGLDLGMNLIDTAEMYGQGESEKVIAEVIEGRREEVYLVSKVYPYNATKRGTIEACERSLNRLRTDYLDLYLLHWRGSAPLAETVEAFGRLKAAGKIRDYGVSNFDRADLEEAVAVEGGDQIRVNQVLYNLQRRGIEWDLLPWSRQKEMMTMAYSPIEQGRLLGRLKRFAAGRGATSAQIALAWLLRNEDLVVIPKSGHPDHVRENFAALKIELTAEDIRELDRLFPPPTQKTNLEML